MEFTKDELKMLDDALFLLEGSWNIICENIDTGAFAEGISEVMTLRQRIWKERDLNGTE